MLIEGIDVSFENPTQIINMGGPWVGDLFVNGKFLSNTINIDNVVFNRPSSQLYFVKYHEISKWQNKNYFTINFLDFSNDIIYEFKKKFDKVYLGRFVNEDELQIYDAFHSENIELQSLFNIKIEARLEIGKFR